jgi:hypothetical protein
MVTAVILTVVGLFVGWFVYDILTNGDAPPSGAPKPRGGTRTPPKNTPDRPDNPL